MSKGDYQSWGRYPKVQQERVAMLWRNMSLPLKELGDKKVIPYGNGRSYGDSCLNNGGAIIDARPLDRFIGFDSESGILRCEAGVLISEILDIAVPKGWFLAVTPGTKFVTVGGAIANDVHGKNHHRAGTFGCHVRRFELLRSNGSRLICSANENCLWFRATIGGLGLTGLITWAEIQLKSISSPFIQQQTIRFRNLDEFFSISSESDRVFEYTVAWVDCLASGAKLGRGHFMRANSVAASEQKQQKSSGTLFSFPLNPPMSLVNHLSLKLFNALYYNQKNIDRKWITYHYEPFFYPLDSIGEWNRIYGPKGFLQYQCVVPHQSAYAAIRELLGRTAKSGTGSFLAILKIFGDIKSPGLLSFPKPGATLTLDFPNQGRKIFSLLTALDQVVKSVRGAVYPAKDARMSSETFRCYFPHWESLKPYIDPRFSSSFWRRVTGESG